MGGRPLLAMNIVCFPIKSMDKSILREVMAGGISGIEEAGALLVGGHSVEDNELKYGLSVTGTVHPQRVMLNSGARPGDRLLLTKPLGTGIISTAVKGGLAGSREEEMITSCMATLNRISGEALAAVGGHGCTDITGFGLIGHLHEMACASGVSIKLSASRVPLLAGAKDFADMGIIPEGAHKNRKFYKEWVTSRLPENAALEMIFYDPQTSGGLLIAAPPADIAAIVKLMENSDYPLPHAIIGEVVKREESLITISA